MSQPNPTAVLQKLSEIEAAYGCGPGSSGTSNGEHSVAWLCAHLRAALQETQWHPIETAPRDGTYILALSKNGAGHWCRPSILTWKRGWQVDTGLYEKRDVIVYHQPTHWMKLPTPPSPTHA